MLTYINSSVRARHRKYSKLIINTPDHNHNMMRFFDVLPNFPFTTKETMCEYYL